MRNEQPPAVLASRKFLRTHEVASIYGLSVGSLQNMRWAGDGPRFFRAGPRIVLYRPEDVEAWIASTSTGRAA